MRSERNRWSGQELDRRDLVAEAWNAGRTEKRLGSSSRYQSGPKLLAFEVKTHGRWLEKDELQRRCMDISVLMLKVTSPRSLRSRCEAQQEPFCVVDAAFPAIPTEKGTWTDETLAIATILETMKNECSNRYCITLI